MIDPAQRSKQLRVRRKQVEDRLEEIRQFGRRLRDAGPEAVTHESLRHATEAAENAGVHARQAQERSIERHLEAAELHERLAIENERRGNHDGAARHRVGASAEHDGAMEERAAVDARGA